MNDVNYVLSYSHTFCRSRLTYHLLLKLDELEMIEPWESISISCSTCMKHVAVILARNHRQAPLFTFQQIFIGLKMFSFQASHSNFLSNITQSCFSQS
jgi:hypothetical protein